MKAKEGIASNLGLVLGGLVMKKVGTVIWPDVLYPLKMMVMDQIDVSVNWAVTNEIVRRSRRSE